MHKCPKCGNPLQATFCGIEHAWANPVAELDSNGKVMFYYVCINPMCADGRLNCTSPSEPYPF